MQSTELQVFFDPRSLLRSDLSQHGSHYNEESEGKGEEIDDSSQDSETRDVPDD